jgi:hypothetical protein
VAAKLFTQTKSNAPPLCGAFCFSGCELKPFLGESYSAVLMPWPRTDATFGFQAREMMANASCAVEANALGDLTE